MWCTIYQLYLDGTRLPSEIAKANGVYGWLYMHSKTPVVGMPLCKAYLLPEPDAPALQGLIKPLMHCHLKLINGGGFRLSGQEWNVHHRHIRQSWWCVPGPALGRAHDVQL